MYFSLNNMGCFCEHYYAFKVKNETKKNGYFFNSVFTVVLKTLLQHTSNFLLRYKLLHLRNFYVHVDLKFIWNSKKLLKKAYHIFVKFSTFHNLLRQTTTQAVYGETGCFWDRTHSNWTFFWLWISPYPEALFSRQLICHLVGKLRKHARRNF